MMAVSACNRGGGMNSEETLDRAASAFRKSRFNLAFTGAGVSVESGLPDFRSPGGLWDRYDVTEYATLTAFQRHPEKVWTFVRELLDSYGGVQPNAGHRALAALEATGALHAVVTQNIDGLHQAAGSRRVVEFHGSVRRLVCLGCGRMCPADDPSVRALPVPRCACGCAPRPGCTSTRSPPTRWCSTCVDRATCRHACTRRSSATASACWPADRRNPGRGP